MGLFDNIKKRKPTRPLRAVYEGDLEAYLSSLEMLAAVESGEINCAYCEKNITKENIGAISSEEQEIKLFCDNLMCIQEAKK